MSDAVALTIVSTIPSIILSIASLVKSIRTGRDVKDMNERLQACEEVTAVSAMTDNATLFHEHMAAVHLKLSMRVTPDDMPSEPRDRGDL